MSEDDRNTERLTLRLDPETMAALRAHAAELGWTMSKLVAESVKAFDREVSAEDGGGYLHAANEREMCDCGEFENRHPRGIAGCEHDPDNEEVES